VLLHHPDKDSQRGGGDGPSPSDAPLRLDIRLINEAKWVLSDPIRRKEWEEIFFNGKWALKLPIWSQGKGSRCS
jgi:hypothetical protein